MFILDIEELRKLKEENRYSYEEISKKSGVPLSTVQKVLGGVTEKPRRSTLEALTKVLLDPSDSLVAEEEFEYQAWKHENTMKADEIISSKSQGEFTVSDYYIISEEWRIELIDGVIYDMASPEYAHQMIAGGVHSQLLNHALEEDDDCSPVISPIDVQLECDDKTMVQPDVVVVCDKGKITKKNIQGAPDLVLEVISPSTRSKDMITKRDKYRQAGCREYWLIDPEKEKVKIFGFESGVDGLFTFDQKIPVQISDGRCIIDFSIIKRQIEKFGDLF